MDVLKIDGSFGEGGGQILRSAITLSCITRRPIQIDNIRNNRKVPGLRTQHLTVVQLLAKICDAKVEGLHAGSTSIRFFPNEVKNLQLKERVGTAASISLILQALIPAVSLAGKKLELSISGGTDVPWSPTTNYTKHVLAEAYSRIGIDFSLKIQRRGYYPRGGGLVDITVYPCREPHPLVLTKRTEKNAKLVCTWSGLDSDKILQSVENAKNILQRNDFFTQVQTVKEEALDRGASILVFGHDLSSINGADELFGEEFGKKSTTTFMENTLGVDSNLSDMIVTPLSLTKERSVFTVKQLTKHLETNLYITSKITGSRYGIGKIEGGFEVRIEGGSESCIQ